MPLRQSKTLAKLRQNQPVRMCALGHYVPAFVRLAANARYDCIWLDLEHRAMGERDVQALLAYFHLFDIDCMLRPPTREKVRLYRYLEDGATGLMVPHVNSADEARDLVRSVKFPPVGDRGLDGAGLDADYLLAGEGYVDHASGETFLVVQIETPEAVDQVGEIAAVKGVDAMFIGTGDLGMRINRCQVKLTINDAITRVADAAQRAGIAWGCPAGSVEQLKELRQLGAQMIAYGGEFRAYLDLLERSADDLDQVYDSTGS